MFDLGQNPVVTEARKSPLLPFHAIENQSHACGVNGTGNNIDQAGNVGGDTKSYRHTEDPFRHFDGPRKQHRSPGQDDSGRQMALVPRLCDLSLHQLKNLLYARFDNLAEDLSRNGARGLTRHAGNFYSLVAGNHGRFGQPVALLDTLRIGGGGAQAGRDVVCKMIAAYTQHRAMSYGAIMESRDIRGSAADIHQCYTELTLFSA